MKLPIRTLGLMAAAVLIGSALSPVAAQQSGVDGQVALRASDNALYLIQNGQRRWIATVALSDNDINAIPEGDPIMTGLALAGSAEAAAQAKPATSAGTTAQAGTTAPAGGSTGTGATAAATPKPTASTGSSASSAPGPKPPDADLSPDIPVEVDLDGSTRIDQGDERKVEIKTQKDVTCELVLLLPGGDQQSEDSKNADTAGRCKYTIEVPDNAKEGNATLVGTVRVGGKMNRQEVAVEITKKK
jgi:hypothetical protein